MKNNMLSAKSQNELYRAAKKNAQKRPTETVSVELQKAGLIDDKSKLENIARNHNIQKNKSRIWIKDE